MATFSSAINGVLEKTGDIWLFLKSVAKNTFRRGFEWDEFLRQCYFIGYRSTGIVLLTGFILGFVLTLQSLPTLQQFGAQSFVPAMVSVSVVREIGPVITALICAGKIASGIGAELGSMKVTEQVDAMEVSGANPTQYLVVTRVAACLIMVPLLTVLADGMSFLGGFTGINVKDGMSAVLYFRKTFAGLHFNDLFPATVKTFFFGFIIGLTGCYKGINSTRGTESVGHAANSAVVAASIGIIIVDAIAVQLTSALLYN